ncbi:ABC transporter substrate-binding protein [Marivivens aquimaris]|uniref:ABC transporter substrate-binding protein n=1 Tax=Marivivens aquimaris TaxID=2774876 RepID=UPI0018826896|nr:ABC transporter substrate-binding protein [Marivivens aquimaris]
MSKFTRHLRGAAVVLSATLATGATYAEDATLRIATQLTGTVNWELTTIRERGLDQENGFTLDVHDVTAGPAGQIALLAGEVDMIVSDWLWVARQRADGGDFVFIPYSRAVGAIYVPEDSSAQTLADLEGSQIGIAGGPVDKSWLILRAYAESELGFDLAGETEQVFGAPPLIFETALSGDLDAAINFWHFGAKMEAAGMRPLMTVAEAGAALGLDPDTPLLGYVVSGEFAAENPDLVASFAAASRAAKDVLATDDSAWEDLRPIMRANSDAQFEALIAGFRAGIPDEGPVDEASAAAMFKIMADLGGDQLVGKAETLPDGVFW